MSELISGKEALIALANGEEVEFNHGSQGWVNCLGLNVEQIMGSMFQLRLKPRTITINGIEVPAPFEPKREEPFYVLNAFSKNGYQCFRLSEDYDSDFENALVNFVWRTEEEIKQVVAALRSIFGKK